MICLDIGCWNGDSALTLIANPSIDSIDAYDPNPDYKKLWDSITDFYPTIKFINKAVSDRNGTAEFTKRPAHLPLGSTLAKNKGDWGMGDIIEVECVDIADIVTERCWLKLDAEGLEFEILERLIDTDKLKLIDTIFLEWHDSKLSGDYTERKDKIYKALDKAKVKVRKW